MYKIKIINEKYRVITSSPKYVCRISILGLYWAKQNSEEIYPVIENLPQVKIAQYMCMDLYRMQFQSNINMYTLKS